jgi:hypothetical protein
MPLHPAGRFTVRLLLGFLALMTVVAGGVFVWLWSSYSIHSWTTWGFRLRHTVVSAQQHALGARTITFVLRPQEDPRQAVKACAQAFESELLYEGIESHCIAFGSRIDAERQQRHSELVCELARATQWAYGSANEATVTMNQAERCGRASS